MISGRTRLLALIGHPIGHSLSPAMHNASFRSLGLDYTYVALDVDPENVRAAVLGAAALNLRGLNVTMPHKQATVPLMDELDEAAGVSGAVNTVVVESGRLFGHNTDGSGMVEACREAGVGLADREVLLLGAGGTAASIAVALCDAGIEGLHIVNRNVERAEQLSRKLRRVDERVRITVGSAAASAAPVIVNATSLGMGDDDPLPIPPGLLDENRAVLDAVYRPGTETALVREARERGAAVVPGGRMLLYQGVLAQRLWTGREPDVAAMEAALSS